MRYRVTDATGKFQFELIPVHADVCPEVLEAPSLPREDDVKKYMTYHYAPCPSPVRNPVLRIPYMHSFLAPGRVHLHDFWVQRTPKKLQEAIREQPHPSGEPAVTGWGVHIDRRPNWGACNMLAQLVLGGSMLFAMVYSLVRRDVSGAFAVAQYAVAAMTMLNALNIAALQHQA
jgi:hypothetical protein